MANALSSKVYHSWSFFHNNIDTVLTLVSLNNGINQFAPPGTWEKETIRRHLEILSFR